VSEDIYSADQQTHLTALNRELESVALHKPEQYQWEYKRWRVRPNGDRNYYPKGT
jgi:KDO2-lipid IV(A) lauroyltransferase